MGRESVSQCGGGLDMHGEHRTVDRERQWYILGRWQEYEGEHRANLLRLAGIGAFYIVQLVSFYVFDNGSVDALPFHRAVTSVAVAWSLVALTVFLLLRNRIFPPGLKFLSTACDIGLLTVLAMSSESKANSPLVYVYFVILVLAGLRFSLPLIWFATIGSMVGYLLLVAASDPTWFDADHSVRPVQQLVVHLSLAMCGVVLGQIIRHVKRLALSYSQRVQEATSA